MLILQLLLVVFEVGAYLEALHNRCPLRSFKATVSENSCTSTIASINAFLLTEVQSTFSRSFTIAIMIGVGTYDSH